MIEGRLFSSFLAVGVSAKLHQATDSDKAVRSVASPHFPFQPSHSGRCRFTCRVRPSPGGPGRLTRSLGPLGENYRLVNHGQAGCAVFKEIQCY
jgi:hypothetical protein